MKFILSMLLGLVLGCIVVFLKPVKKKHCHKK